MTATLPELLERRARESPDALAFVDADRRLTFGQLAEGAARIAASLERRGVRAHDRVALVLPAGAGFVETYWALLLLGAVPCALSPTTPAPALRRRLETLAPRLVLDEHPRRDGAAVVPARHVPQQDDVALLQFTSGTTGEPRAAMVTQRNLIAELRVLGAIWRIEPQDVFVGWVPPWHDLGLVAFVIAPVGFGTACHIVPPAIRTIPRWLTTISSAGATVTAAPDFAYRTACRLADPRAVDLSTLRVAGSGGEPVRRTTIERFEERFRAPGIVAPGYGLAEATMAVTSQLPAEELVVDARGNVCCGRPPRGVQVQAAGTPEAPGDILVRGEIVFAGYLGAPVETAAVLRDGWLLTGDVGYTDEAGRLFVLGRRRAMIKRAGAVVAPRELEEAAAGVRGVRQAAAVGVPVPGSTAGEQATVFVESEDPAATLSSEVHEAIRRSVGFGARNVVVVSPGSIPMTSSGKIRYAELSALLHAQALEPDRA